MTNKHVTVIGGGVAGLSAALELSRFDLDIDVIETSPFLGGHAIRLACKATDACVKCGACIVEEKLLQALQNPHIRLHTNARIENMRQDHGFHYDRIQIPHRVDPDRCTFCGACLELCPAGAVQTGTSSGHKPFFTLDPELCLNAREEDCRACQEGCPENAIHLDADTAREACQSDAMILATGFTPFDPEIKPYGYRHFQNVITNLELEEKLRQTAGPLTMTDGKVMQKIAFIQCVGSRDAKLNHLWCSKVCCGSSLNLAGLIQWRQPDTSITVFYIDIQNFGKNFDQLYHQAQNQFNFQRSIPADIFERDDGRLQVHFADSQTQKGQEATFDMVVLAIGLCPPKLLSDQEKPIDTRTTDDGFIKIPESGSGIFTAGAATGPMGIAESVASAESAAWSTIRYLQRSKA